MTTRRYALRFGPVGTDQRLTSGTGRISGGNGKRQSIVCPKPSCIVTLAGIPWRDLPERFGDFRLVHTRFSRWSKTGVWERVFQHLANNADNEEAMIDATIVRAHQQACGRKKGEPDTEAIGRSKGGLSRKIHATTDALGNPLNFHLTPGQACDLDGADQLLPDLLAKTVLVDKAYDADDRASRDSKPKARRR